MYNQRLSFKIFCTTSSGVMSDETCKYSPWDLSKTIFVCNSHVQTSKPVSEPSGQLCLLPPPQQAQNVHIQPGSTLSCHINVFVHLLKMSINITINTRSTFLTSNLCQFNGVLVAFVPLADPLHLLLQAHVQHHNLQVWSHPASKIWGIWDILQNCISSAGWKPDKLSQFFVIQHTSYCPVSSYLKICISSTTRKHQKANNKLFAPVLVFGRSTVWKTFVLCSDF